MLMQNQIQSNMRFQEFFRVCKGLQLHTLADLYSFHQNCSIKAGWKHAGHKTRIKPFWCVYVLGPSLQITGPDDTDGTNGTAANGKSFQQNPVQMAFQVCSHFRLKLESKNIFVGQDNFMSKSIICI